MDITWINKRVTREELLSDPDGARRWQALLDLFRPGDELWEFTSPPETWHHLAGRAGVTLVRDGKIIESVLTIMN